MLAESYTAVIARGEDWVNGSTTEPYEAGWAREAMIVIRTLEADRLESGCVAHVQVSLDGMHWADEGTTIAIAPSVDGLGLGRVTGFGHYLRLRVEMPETASGFMLATLNLKA